jgi:hypothetical protein
MGESGFSDYHPALRVDAAARLDRSFCTTCGWVLSAGPRSTCSACGGNATPLPLTDNLRPLPREDDDDATLSSARDAWALGDHPRALERALTFGAAPRSFSSPSGPGWVTTVGSTPVFALFDIVPSTLSLEVPVVRLPQTKRVAALRAALVLCNDTAAASRFCLRGDLLVARVVARIEALSPALVRRLAREIASCASRTQEQFAAAFDARPAIPEQGRDSPWERSGRPQALAALAPPGLSPPASQARPSAHPNSPSSRPSAPSVLQGVQQPRAITLRLSIPPSALTTQDTIDDDMPAVLAPDFADDGSGAPTVPPPSRSLSEAPSPRAGGMLPPAIPAAPMATLHSATPVGTRVPISTTGEATPASRRPARLSSQDVSTPEGKMCELIRQALALATVLSFEEKPHTMLLLVRAAVFRAVHDHIAVLPSAVAYLYRATRSVTREIWTTKADPSRNAALPVPVAEPALGALEQILAARANIPKEKPVVIEPWVSAAQAKEHLGKFLVEIELAPQDPMLRHYLALGALCELLVRARLPSATDQRLRDIVAYAQRDGMKPHVIELMMTALRKIVAG